MSLAVCLLFDRDGDRLVRQLWARLEAQGVPTLATHTHRRHRPHLSLAVLRAWTLDAVLDEMAALPAAAPSTLWFQGAVTFTRGRVSLAAGISLDLARRQDAVARALVASGADLHRHYESGRWVPHVSLATGSDHDQLTTIRTVVNDALPIALRVTAAAVIDSSTGQAWPLPALL